MKPQFFLASALALSLFSGAALLPGCGGGSSGGSSPTSVPNTQFIRQNDVQFIDFPEYRGVLRVNSEDSAGFPLRASGTLQVVDVPNFKPSTEPRTGFSVGLPPGTYILNGNLIEGTNGFKYDLDVGGSYQGGPRFRLTGNFDDQGLISISAPFKTDNSVLRGRLLPLGSTPGATTTGATTTGATTTGATTTGATTTGATTTGATTTGAATTGATTTGGTTGTTTAGLTMAGGTTAGGTTTGATTGGTNTGGTTGATTAGTTAGGGTTGATSVGQPPSVP